MLTFCHICHIHNHKAIIKIEFIFVHQYFALFMFLLYYYDIHL